MPSESENPLSEASPNSLDILFSRRPPHSEADLDIIIAKLREQRELFLKAEAAGKRAPRPSKEPKEKPAPLSLDDLGL